jgi:CelD/BcsL family acetyltransferase involved in cellulose biosynthesis
VRVRRLASLTEPPPEAWTPLTGGVPFRAQQWLVPWWQSYKAPGAELYLLGCWDGRELLGLLPLYRQRSPLYGRCLRLLGDGEACSEYQGVLCLPGAEAAVAEALAEFVLEAGRHRTRRAPDDGWDLMDLGALDPEDQAMGRLLAALAPGGAKVACWPGARCWRLDLPSTWEGYLAVLSQSHRRQLRRLSRRLEEDPGDEGGGGAAAQSARPGSGKGPLAILRWARTPDEAARLFGVVEGLHQARRQSKGDRGTFASPRFQSFMSSALQPLFARGLVWLSGVEVEGRLVSAELHLVGRDSVYGYLCGNSVDALHLSPGRIARIGAVRRAIAEGFTGYDFLRGDEPYKKHYRATPRPTLRALISSPRPAARLHHGLLVAGRSARAALRDLRSALRPPTAAEPAAESAAESTE